MRRLLTASLLAVVMLLPLSACTPRPRAFVPAERATALSPLGYPAAVYDISFAGEVVGEARVWSEGAFWEEDAGPERALLHVAFSLESYGPEIEIEIDSVAIDRAAIDGSLSRDLEPTYMEGSITATEGGEAEAHFYFALPHQLRPRHLRAFRVRWSVRGGDDARYVQRTPFLKHRRHAPPRGVVFVHSPFYDPFLFPPPYYYPPHVIVRPMPFRHPPRVPPRPRR